MLLQFRQRQLIGKQGQSAGSRTRRLQHPHRGENSSVVDITFSWTSLLLMIGTSVPSAIIHELGHIIIGWCCGCRDARIYLGSLNDKKSVLVPCGPITLRVYIGLGLLTEWPRYRFGIRGRQSVTATVLTALGGPLASLAVAVWLHRRLVIIMSSAVAGQYAVQSVQDALAVWALSGAFFPLIPMRYRSGDPSDGFTLLQMVTKAIPWGGKKHDKG